MALDKAGMAASGNLVHAKRGCEPATGDEAEEGEEVVTDHVIVQEKWTRTEGWRKVGHGEWEPIDLSCYGGRIPFVVLNPNIDWWQITTWEAKP